MRHEITLRVNGAEETHEVSSNTTLLEFLRDTLDLTGAKEGCNEGECGACTVLLDGQAVNACLVLAAECDAAEVVTVEGLGRAGALHPLQAAFLRNHAVQCGFCTPGMLMTSTEFLEDHPAPTRDEVRASLDGNLCRCTGYKQIVDAVVDAAAVIRRNDGRQP
jgi:carbon-monoxide dehydrogenase small subunit